MDKAASVDEERLTSIGLGLSGERCISKSIYLEADSFVQCHTLVVMRCMYWSIVLKSHLRTISMGIYRPLSPAAAVVASTIDRSYVFNLQAVTTRVARRWQWRLVLGPVSRLTIIVDYLQPINAAVYRTDNQAVAAGATSDRRQPCTADRGFRRPVDIDKRTSLWRCRDVLAREIRTTVWKDWAILY